MNIKKLLFVILTVIISYANSLSQVGVKWDLGGNLPAGGSFLGTNAGSINLDFHTNGALKMTLTTGGDLNLTLPARRYQINGQNVLWHNGTTSNIFVGVGADRCQADRGKPKVTCNTDFVIGVAEYTVIFHGLAAGVQIQGSFVGDFNIDVKIQIS